MQMGGSTSYLLHSDALGSTTMETDQAGSVNMDALFYPWGQWFQWTGPGFWASYAGLGLTNVGDVYPAQHRNYQATLGRWLTPDPGGVKVVKLNNPQTWNMYAYVTDNPTSRNDPSGLYTANCSEDVKKCTKQINNFNKSLLSALKSKNASMRAAAAAYGKLGEKNGVNVTFAKVVDPKHSNVAGITTAQAGTGGITYDAATGEVRQATQVTIKAGQGGSTLEETAIHEGVHVEDRAAFVNSIDAAAGSFNRSLNITARQSELNAYGVENAFRISVGLPTLDIRDILARPPYSDNPYIDMPLFPDLPGPQ